MRPFLFLMAVSLVGLVPHAAFADPSDADRATARALAHEGFDAQQRADYEVAADRFSRAEALVHAPTLLLGLARAQVGLGKLAEAYETYQRIVSEPLPPHAPAVFGKAVEDGKRELSALSSRLGWVTIRVDGATSPIVTIDDDPVSDSALGVRRPYAPGRHVVQASAPGFEVADKTFQVSPGEEQDVRLKIQPLRTRPTSVATVPETGTRAPVRMTLTFASFGLGAAGLITGSVAGIWVLTKHSSLSSSCQNDVCPSADAGDVSTYRTLANVSTAAFIVAGVGAAAGVTLLLTEPKAKTLGAYLGPASAGVIGTF